FWGNWNLAQRRCLKFLWIWSFSYFLIISIPVVKLEWYDAPLFPIMALLAAFSVYWLIQRFQSIQLARWLKVLFTIAFLAGIYSNALEKTLAYLTTEPLLHEQEYAGTFMKKLAKNQPDLNQYTIVFEPQFPEHLDQAKFYQKALNFEHGYHIDLQESLDKITVKDTILTCQTEKIDSIGLLFDYQILAEDGRCKLLYLKGEL
ncbi:MAG: hypothetical protein AAF705_17965, partial [Bacteroidota bacterium]